MHNNIKNNAHPHFQPSGLQVYSSPLPPPEALEKYERVQLGLVEKIIQLTEQQANHRRGLEMKQLNEQIKHQARRDCEAKLGQVFAFLIAGGAIAGGVYTALQGHEWAGSVIGVVGLSGIITPFLIGRQEKNRN